MFSIKIVKNKFHLNRRLFVSVSENVLDNFDHVESIKTVIDKNKNIKRISKTGIAWESVIGLEVHAQINAQTKIFSSAPHEFNSPVNSNVSYFDASIPGTLPVLNRRCVEAGVMTALALGSQVNKVSFFDRKHYFYADLPAGYQITQQRQPLAVGGRLEYPVLCQDLSKNIYTKSCDVIQLQLEQDSAKSLHDTESGLSLVDLNRCGAGLMEIVFGPHLSHGEEAAALVKELILILETLDTCKSRMDQGELRVDANISVRKLGDKQLGVRTEVKNINSVRSVAKAVEYEVARQIYILENGGVVENETRSFDYSDKITVAMRDKEAKQDYRFMPEPNLPPLRLTDTCEGDDGGLVNIQTLRSAIPEMPVEVRTRLMSEFDLSELSAAQLVEWPLLLEYFNLCAEFKPVNHNQVCNLIFSIVHGLYINQNIRPLDTNLLPRDLVEASNLRQNKEISASAVQEILNKKISGDSRSVATIVEEENLYLIRDLKYIEEFVDDVLKSNSEMVTKYKKEKNPKKVARAFQSLITKVNQDSRVEKVDMTIFTEILKSNLEK